MVTCCNYTIPNIGLPEKVVTAHRQDVRPAPAAADETSPHEVVPASGRRPFLHEAQIRSPCERRLVSEETEHPVYVLP